MPANCMVLFELMARLMNLDFFFSGEFFGAFLDFQEGEAKNYKFEYLSFETHNMIQNGGSPILFLFFWPVVVMVLLAIVPLAKFSKVISFIKNRLFSIFYMGFVLRILQEISLELFINSFLNFEEHSLTPSGELVSIITTLILFTVLLSGPIVLPILFLKHRHRVT